MNDEIMRRLSAIERQLEAVARLLTTLANDLEAPRDGNPSTSPDDPARGGFKTEK